MRSIGSLFAVIGMITLVVPTNAQEFQANKKTAFRSLHGQGLSPFARRTSPERPYSSAFWAGMWVVGI